MKFSKAAPVAIAMLGAGGTGGHAAPNVYRLLHSLRRPSAFTVCDGDLVERKNLVRQNFVEADLGRNKAQVIAKRYARAFGTEASYLPEFVESREALERLFRGGLRGENRDGRLNILLGCVDNNRSRRVCHEAFMAADNLVYIDAGNGESTGQVVCGVRLGGRTASPPVGELHPEILEDGGALPSELGCAEAAMSAPQSMAANIMAAAAMASMLYGLLAAGEIRAARATFSAASVSMKAVAIGG